MRRLDFERTPLRNPFNKETPGRILYRKWSNSVAFEGGWWKAYGLSVFCVAYLVLLIVLWVYPNFGTLNVTIGNGYWRAAQLLGILYIFTRYQLCALPALTLVKESKESLWVHFKMTLAGGHTAAFAMFWFAFDRCVIPLVVIATPYAIGKILLNNFVGGIHFSIITYVILVPVIILIFGLIGLILSGLGFIGVMVKRNKITVISAVIAPLIISILIAGNQFIREYTEAFTSVTMRSPGHSLPIMLIEPEDLVLFSMEQPGSSLPIMLSWPPIIHAITTLAILSVIIWLGLWIWLRISLPDPHLEKQL